VQPYQSQFGPKSKQNGCGAWEFQLENYVVSRRPFLCSWLVVVVQAAGSFFAFLPDNTVFIP
jgi:hypothetical protein